MFDYNIKRFNGIYKLPVATEPSLYQLGESATDRLKNFRSILTEELSEINDIISKLEENNLHGRFVHDELDMLTDLADLFGDIQVYCASEMVKFGLPIDAVLELIMLSNFSKLDSDGNPIYDGRGKVQKGPAYWKPEPQIKNALQELITKNREAESGEQEMKQLLNAHNKAIHS